jgi:hypothetical protein
LSRKPKRRRWQKGGRDEYGFLCSSVPGNSFRTFAIVTRCPCADLASREGAVTQAIIIPFIKKVQDLKRTDPLERIINIDETNWRTVETGLKTWVVKGAESVHCNVDNDDKAGGTVIAAVEAAGTKLPLARAKRKDVRRDIHCHRKSGGSIPNRDGRRRTSCAGIFGI